MNRTSEDEPEPVGIGQYVRIRQLPLIQYPPDLIGAKAVVVAFNFSGKQTRYVLELKVEDPAYSGRTIQLKRHAFTTDVQS